MVSLIPKEGKFFELFDRAARNVHDGAEQLVGFLENYHDRTNRAKKIKELEHRGDQITHETITLLNKTFVTPFDREDIHRLVCRMDDILDLTDTTVSRMVLYQIKSPTDEIRQLALSLRGATAIIVEAVGLLPKLQHTQGIIDKCIAIHTQENEADRIEQGALASLFEKISDAKELIKWKDVYEELEAATDRCEDVANVLESIVLKNA